MSEPESIEDYAARVQAAAVEDCRRPDFRWAIGGSAPDWTANEVEYAIEPDRGSCARNVTDELYDAIESLPDFRDGARIITRAVSYGPWCYVTPEEIRS